MDSWMNNKSDIPVIKVAGLKFAYNGREVIQGLDLEVPGGSFHGVLGPNGSGKTTLVKLLTRLVKPKDGRIELMGEPIENWGPRRLARQMAVVPQSTHVAFPFTTLEVVLMGRAPHLGGLEIEGQSDLEIARSAMEMTETWELRNRTIQEISGGEAQRVIVARALAQKPRILLMDEPTTHLDIKHQIEVMELLKKLNKEDGLTVIIISHDLNLIARYVEFVVLLDKGKIFSAGGPAEVLTARNIRAVYDANVEVFDIQGRPGIIPATKDGGSV
jgi:iron complex transport system ATP-binding protein